MPGGSGKVEKAKTRMLAACQLEHTGLVGYPGSLFGAKSDCVQVDISKKINDMGKARKRVDLIFQLSLGTVWACSRSRP